MSAHSIKSICRWLLVFCLLTTTIAMPALYEHVGALAETTLGWFSLYDKAAGAASIVMNLAAMLLVMKTVERTLGYNARTTTDLEEIWTSLPRWFRIAMIVMAASTLPFQLEGLVVFFLKLSFAEASIGMYHHELLVLGVPRFLLFFPAPMVNGFLAILVSGVLVYAHFRLPRWGRVPLPGGALTRHATLNFDYDPDSKEFAVKRKAERYIEKGRLVKAAKLFETLGQEHAYRAGKLYYKSRRDREASRAFKTAGSYFLGRNNFMRAGDAFFFGGHWDQAVDAYKRATAPELILGEKEVVQTLIRRWGEALYRLGRYMEAATLYEENTLDKLAGEAYEKAGRPHEAAEAYGRAGAFDASFKALMDSGHHDLAQVEKGKLHLQRDEYLEAAREFEKGKHFLYAAEAYEKANIHGRAARNYLLAGRPETAVTLFLASGEEFQALNCYEVMEDWDKAAQLAAHMGLQDKQALYYERAEHWIAAARSYLMIYESEKAVACLSRVTLSNETIAAECAHLLTLLLQQNRLQEALSCAQGLLAGRKPKVYLAPLVFVLAKIQEKLGKPDKAAKYFIQAAQMVPDREEYVGNAKRLSARMGIRFSIDPVQERDTEPSVPKVDEPAVPRPRSKPVAVRVPRRERPATVVTNAAVPHLDGDTPGDEITLTIDEHSVYDLTEEGALARYQVIGEIGRGGMGYVYKARDKKLKRFVALKMLHPEMNREPRVVLFFKREAMSIASLNHPNLVSLYDMGKEKGCFFMVMEYLEGGTLKSHIKKNHGVLRKHLVTIWLQVCEGMRYAHANGIIHRDIKPTNIMITRDRRVKILDFGLAKAVTDVNQTKQLWGTPSFMAPELFQGDRAGFQTDIYGLGATFYMVATRKKPFADKDLGRKFSGDGLPVAPHVVDPRIPRELSAVIQRCLYVNPEDRFQTVEELIRQLKQLERRKRVG